MKFRTMRAGDGRRRRAAHPARAVPAGDQPRRAARALERAAGRHEPRRPAPAARGVPRPLLARQARRHEVRPGLTGLAQVEGRNLVAWDERLELDVRYVETRSLRARPADPRGGPSARCCAARGSAPRARRPWRRSRGARRRERRHRRCRRPRSRGARRRRGVRARRSPASSTTATPDRDAAASGGAPCCSAALDRLVASSTHDGAPRRRRQRRAGAGRRRARRRGPLARGRRAPARLPRARRRARRRARWSPPAPGSPPTSRSGAHGYVGPNATDRPRRGARRLRHRAARRHGQRQRSRSATACIDRHRRQRAPGGARSGEGAVVGAGAVVARRRGRRASPWSGVPGPPAALSGSVGARCAVGRAAARARSSSSEQGAGARRGEAR